MMKNGMASSGKESMPPNISVGSTAMGTVPDSTMKARPPSPRQNAMGTPSVMVSAKTTTRRRSARGHSSTPGGRSRAAPSKPSRRATMTSIMSRALTGRAR